MSPLQAPASTMMSGTVPPLKMSLLRPTHRNEKWLELDITLLRDIVNDHNKYNIRSELQSVYPKAEQNYLAFGEIGCWT